MTENITIDDISHFLINNNYQLTALEFDFELIERGNENKFLRNFFTNPENFENVTTQVELPSTRIKASPSISTIDSIDFAKYSDDGMQQSDERIKVLEFELRKKNEEVRKLREEVTKMSTLKSSKSIIVDDIPNSTAFEDYEINSDEPLMAYENRVLNFLINEYLLQHGFKLTAVSFSEEITDQDLDTWDDVGLNIPKLPNLECFLRAKKSHFEEDISKENMKKKSFCETEIQTDTMDEFNGLIESFRNSNLQLQNTVDSLTKELENMHIKFDKTELQLKEQIQSTSLMKKELNDTRSKLICAQRDLMYESVKKKVVITGNQSTSGDTDFKSETVSNISDAINENGNQDIVQIKEDKLFSQLKDDEEKNYQKINLNNIETIEIMLEEIVTHRNPTPAFTKALKLINDNDEDDSQNLMTLVDSLDQFVSLVTDILPNLFEAINSKDNPHLTILLVQCTCLHPDSKTREKLLRFLINLHPEPSVTERNMIMKQIQILSGYLGAFRVEAELITQIWEMLYDKPKPNANKRILLANICGIVCPLAPANLRSSLILSIHQQMLEEENDVKVIPHILLSIASTIPYLEDVDKIPHVISILANYTWKNDPLNYKKISPDNEISAEEVVKFKLLPAVAQWCLDAGILHSSLLHEILISMKNIDVSGSNIDYHAICWHLNVIQFLVPFIDVWINLSTPQLLDDTNDDVDSTLLLKYGNEKVIELYRIDVIVTREKYHQFHTSFLSLTSINIPKSLIANNPDEADFDNSSTLQCWTLWPELKWLQTELINALVYLLINIRPKLDKVDLTDSHVVADLAKNQFTSSPLKSKELCKQIGAILFDLGCRLSASVINNFFIPCFSRYLYESSAKGVDCNLKSDKMNTGVVSGYCALLAALVHMDNSTSESLKKFLTNISFLVSVESLSFDGIKLVIDVLSSGFGNVNLYTDIILSSLQPCIACPSVPVRLFVCVMLQELVIQLSNYQFIEDSVFITIINSLKNLLDCSHEIVKVMSVGPLVSILQTRSIIPSTRTQVYNCLSDLMNESVNFKSDSSEKINSSEPCTEVLITALIQMINVVGPTSPESFKDETILPWLLGITEINNGTHDITRRSGIAMILYSTFSTLSYYLESSNSLETCLLPALDRLRLDMLELYPENVKEVESMSQEIRKRIEVKQKSAFVDTTLSMKNKIAGLNFMNRSTSVSSATSSIFGKFKDLKESNSVVKSEDATDQTSANKSNITNFFSKRR